MLVIELLFIQHGRRPHTHIITNLSSSVVNVWASFLTRVFTDLILVD